MAKDQGGHPRKTGETLAESLRTRRLDADSRWRRWHEGAYAIDRDKIRLTGSPLAHPLSRADVSPVSGVSRFEDPSYTRMVLKELHETMVSDVLSGDGGVAALAALAADAARAPVAVVVPDLGTAVMPAGTLEQAGLDELEHWVRERVQGRPSAARDDIVSEVPLQLGDDVVGVVAVLHSSVNPHPLAPWVLDVAAAAALTAVAVEHARIDAEHRLRGSFLEQLRSGTDLDAAEIIRRARRLGCDVTCGAVMLCVEVEGGRPRMVASTIVSDYPGAFAEPLDVAATDDSAQQVWAILPAVAGDDPVAATEAAAKRVATRLRQYGPVGVSQFHRYPQEFRRALDEAELMLDVMRRSVVPSGDEIVDGTYKLLFRLLASHPDELSNYHETTIAPLVQHDEQYRTDLVRTLEAYLDTNCNMNVTAETIFAHRHTVAHRLERIQELTGLDASVHEDRERLGLGLKIHRLMIV
jgi:sugar diacid utilization regulator